MRSLRQQNTIKIIKTEINRISVREKKNTEKTIESDFCSLTLDHGTCPGLGWHIQCHFVEENTHIYMHIYVHTHIHMYTHMHVYIYIHIYVYKASTILGFYITLKFIGLSLYSLPCLPLSPS